MVTRCRNSAGLCSKCTFVIEVQIKMHYLETMPLSTACWVSSLATWLEWSLVTPQIPVSVPARDCFSITLLCSRRGSRPSQHTKTVGSHTISNVTALTAGIRVYLVDSSLRRCNKAQLPPLSLRSLLLLRSLLQLRSLQL